LFSSLISCPYAYYFAVRNFMYFAKARGKKADIERWNTDIDFAWMKEKM